MSNTSSDITEQVEQCVVCKQWFVLELEGSGQTCDKCADAMILNTSFLEGTVAL